jgi:hypothetical protein
MGWNIKTITIQLFSQNQDLQQLDEKTEWKKCPSFMGYSYRYYKIVSAA